SRFSVETPLYSAVFDKSTGQCLLLQSKNPKPQPIYVRPDDGRSDSSFPLPAISIPALKTEENQPQILRLTDAPGEHDEILEGPVFSAVKGVRHFLAANGDSLASVAFTYIF